MLQKFDGESARYYMKNVAVSLMMCSDDYICPLNYLLPATED